MARIRGKNTVPELLVRRMISGLGYRYRLHVRDLPGTPDIVLRPRRKVIFVHGCFWHGHQGCRRATIPQTRTDFWTKKLRANRQRDGVRECQLTESGWAVLVIWECETKDQRALSKTIKRFLT